MDGIINIKKILQEEFIYGQKNFLQATKKRVLHIFIFPMEKFSRQLHITTGKKKDLSKEYDKDGNIITLLEYNNDFLVSRERINRTDSKGLKQGEWKEFYPNGGIKSEKTL